MRQSLARCATRGRSRTAKWSASTRTVALDKKRSEIVEPELIKHTLEQLKPSLPAPGTCDLIDFNPGPCIWSKALHDTLKPRRHVLVELDQKRFANEMAPLLKDPSYRLTKELAAALDHKQDLLSPELQSEANSWPEQIRLQPTKQLIITANLSSKAVTKVHFTGPMSKFFVNQYYKAILYGASNLAFGKLGIPKLLLWLPDKHKLSLLPRTTVFRSRPSLSLEACCDVREITGSFYNDDVQAARQTKHINAIAQMDVVAKLPTAIKDLPSDRIQPQPSMPYAGIPMDLDSAERYRALQDKPRIVTQFLTAFDELRKTIPEEDLLTLDYRGFLEAKHPQMKDYLFFRSRLQSLYYAHERIEALATEQIGLERSVVKHAKANTPSRTTRYLAQLQRKFASINERIAERVEDTQQTVMKTVDDFRALLSTPPALAWNRRPHEPILCHEDDFSRANTKMCLLEITPKESFHKEFDSPSKVLCLEYVMDCFLVKTRATLNRALQQLLVMTPETDEFKNFVRQVPGLSDRSRGIVNDFDSLRVRALPIETWIEIAKVYHDWPHRKSDERMTQAMSSGRENVGSLRD